MYYLININISNEEPNHYINFDFKYIFLGNTINNRILENGKFTRIYYSTPLCSFNGIYTLLNINDIIESNCNNSFNNKLKINAETNGILLNNIKQLEEKILKVVEIKNKTLSCNISNDLMKGVLKLNYKHNINISQIMLKISGIWETSDSYGLSYKYYYLNEPKLT
jgi:hypothetical protein